MSYASVIWVRVLVLDKDRKRAGRHDKKKTRRQTRWKKDNENNGKVSDLREVESQPLNSNSAHQAAHTTRSRFKRWRSRWISCHLMTTTTPSRLLCNLPSRRRLRMRPATTHESWNWRLSYIFSLRSTRSSWKRTKRHVRRHSLASPRLPSPSLLFLPVVVSLFKYLLADLFACPPRSSVSLVGTLSTASWRWRPRSKRTLMVPVQDCKHLSTSRPSSSQRPNIVVAERSGIRLGH